MSTPAEVVVAVFKDPARADAMINTLKQMHKSGAVKVVDVARVSHGPDGKAKLQDLGELTAVKGGERGAIVGGILGLVFPPSILASAAVGAVAGGLWGKLRDTGMKTGDLQTIADELNQDEIAVIAVVEDIWVQPFLAAAEGYERLFRQALDAEAAAIIAADPDTGEGYAAVFAKTDAPAAPAPAPQESAPAASSPPASAPAPAATDADSGSRSS